MFFQIQETIPMNTTNNFHIVVCPYDTKQLLKNCGKKTQDNGTYCFNTRKGIARCEECKRRKRITDSKFRERRRQARKQAHRQQRSILVVDENPHEPFELNDSRKANIEDKAYERLNQQCDTMQKNLEERFNDLEIKCLSLENSLASTLHESERLKKIIDILLACHCELMKNI